MHQPEVGDAAAVLRRSLGANDALFECEIGMLERSCLQETGLCIRIIFTGRFTFTALNLSVQLVALTFRHCETQ